MSDKSNNPFQFWEELKRRKVIRVIIGYAAVAYLILELVSIIAEPLGLPGWTINLVLVLLCVGFIIAIFLSWIFDFTSEGIKKTESAKVAMAKEVQTKPDKRKLKVSDIVIAVLVVFVVILAYPKIFNNDRLEGIRNPEGKISIAVMPFDNLSGDSLYNVWQGGFQNLLITTLSNSEELLVRQYQTMSTLLDKKNVATYASLTPSIASDLALSLETRTFILGKILKAGNKIRVNAQLVNSETEEIFKTFKVEGYTEDDIFVMADSLSGLIKNYLEIKKLAEKHSSSIIGSPSFTNSAEAFQYYIHGWDSFMGLDFQTATESLSKAIEIDSNFLSAFTTLSYVYMVSGNDKLAKHWCNLAYKKRDDFSLKGKLLIDQLNAYYFGTPNEEIKYLRQILEIDELNSTYWFLLGFAYYLKLQNYEDAVINFEKALEINKKWGTNFRNPWIYWYLGDSYHQVNEHKKEKEIYKLGLSVFPQETRIIQQQAICALSQGDTEAANDFIAKYKSISKNKNQWPESRILSGIGTIYTEANIIAKAEICFRQALTLDPVNPSRIHDLAWFLIDNDINIDEGMDLVQKALKERPDDWYYLDTKGWGLYKQGRYEESLKVLNDSWELRPFFDHTGFLHIQEVEKALAKQESEQ